MRAKRLFSLLITAALLAGLMAVPAAASQETETAENVYTFDAVTVNEDDTVDGVEGDNLTMVIDGVETAMEPGDYEGGISITVTESFTVAGSSGGGASGEMSGEASGEVADTGSEASEEAEAEASGEAEETGTASGEASASGSDSVTLTKTILGTELISSRSSTDYRTALYVDEDGINASYSVLAAIVGGIYDNESAVGISITAGSDTFSGLVVEGVEYTLSDAEIVLDTDSHGGTTNDFSGLGSAVSAYGSGTNLTIEDSYIETDGVVKTTLFVSGGADVLIQSSELVANGGVVYDTYLSNANQGTMIGAPWHLGIDNALGNSRAVNLMGAQTTLTIVDSSVYAAGWGALSVDDGSYMRMDVINTEVTVDEGYGAFAIGQVTENYYGATFSSGVLDFIMMGGHVTFQSYTGGDVVTVKRMEVKDEGEGIDTYYAQETDEVVRQVSSNEVEEGETVYSTLYSERFGFEMHSMMLNDTVNTVQLLDGTSLTTGETSFIVKSGFAEITIDNATVTTGESPYTGDTVFLQIMDNDDGFYGLTDFAYSTFGEYFWEPDGWSFEFVDTTDTDDYDMQGNPAYDVMDYGTEATGDLEQWWTTLTLTNTDITGDIWNSTGYWTQGGSDLYVSIGEGATVTGVISAGAYQHYAKTYEVGLYGYYAATGEDSVGLEGNTWYNSENSGSWENAKYISVVTNTPYYYGANGVEVSITDGGVWNVTDVCFLTGLTVDGGAVSGAEAIYKVTVSVTDQDNAVDTVTVDAIEQVDWDGGDIELAVDDIYTLYVVLPAGTDIDDVLLEGESLGYSTKEFEGQYFGSFYDPETGLLDTPLVY
ncbi:MAG: hypothetical protein LUE21_00330 [Oscillospiraceae bacterium]|nr:hypothetical protein [Oscillospiraceae bacterium]